MAKYPVNRTSERERTDQARNQLVKHLIADERAKVDAKTAKLKKLRLAREAADKAAAAANPPLPKRSKPKRAKAGARSN